MTASAERSFSQMKLIKTRLQSSLNDKRLPHLMKIAIESHGYNWPVVYGSYTPDVNSEHSGQTVVFTVYTTGGAFDLLAGHSTNIYRGGRSIYNYCSELWNF